MTDDQPDFSAYQPATIAARGHYGWCGDTGAIIPPIHLSTTFARDAAYERVGPGGYTRDDNPTYLAAERTIAALEGGMAARLFASGMAAIAAVFQALAPGDRVVVSKDQYFGTPKWLREWAMRWGLSVDFVDSASTDALARAVAAAPTRLVFVETPANPTWAVTDIAAAAAIARQAGATLVVDNTAATPVLTRPIALGADLVVHSATKYLNGHSDALVGAVVTARDDALWERIGQVRYLAGPVPGPMEAWLLLRGMRTLHLRVERACHNAMAIARHFERHPGVAEVCYPGLDGFPGHAVAARQMRGGFGGMLSLRIRPRRGESAIDAAVGVARRVRLITRATSLGGVETLIEHRKTVEGDDSDVPADLLRLSVGIEAVEDLIDDLEQALETL